ncbi:MAG TPA: hypothetical protein VG076_10495, partial [Acidimicrobiales bacterium]|nr:hypothetical protein [Acidimicrobiales bacterium]
AIADQVASDAVSRALSTPGARVHDLETAQRQLTAAHQRWAVDKSDAWERLKQAWRSANDAAR